MSATMSLTPNITLFNLEVSRSIRIAWLLEELNIPYKLVSSPRGSDGLAPKEFRNKIGTFLGKSPTIEDNGVVVQESGAITEYICENYDKANRMLPASREQRAKVREFIAAAEATLLLHAMPVFFTRWRISDENAAVRESFEDDMSKAILKDLDWLEFELTRNAEKSSDSKFLVGQTLTAADTMMAMSVQSIFQRQLGTRNLVGSGRWKAVEEWLMGLEALDSYKRAAEKVNYNVPNLQSSKPKI